jgi:hypothetical protein
MRDYRELSQPMHSGQTKGDWVDFPSPDLGALLRQANRFPPDVSHGGYWDAKRVAGAVVTSFAIALRGVLVTAAALGIVAYLLLTNSHI